ncbi:unnamed protein product [Acanthoscelides obtectus]|uniref:RRM domain-containing protein n=1 Tax=Acanthoscelides obtectus TaxID=200917 RepID=A0A9P0PAZ9_ACAOB|nr:unnamed protein product [Acanthoscelides obtectus]CAK1654703.1 Serine-arginine protein 55 [Acanthoscelides obtectus]
MNRYLLNIAYMGKPFLGAQRQLKGGSPRPPDPYTVQGRLEMGLKQLNPCNDPIVAMSSRTDAGVSAINATCHADLYRKNGTLYDPLSVTLCLNKYFKKRDVPIRVLRTCIVPPDFHCGTRSISRTYLYRLTIAKANQLNIAPNCHYIPIEEWDRSLFYCTNTFNVETMRDAAKLLEGYHDFRTFMGTFNGCLDKVTRKYIEEIKIVQNTDRGYSPYSWPQFIQHPKSEFLFLDIYVKGKGFLYRQVRRSVASLVAVAQGERVTVERARGTPRGRDQWSSSRSDHRSHERYGPPTRTNYRLIVENLSSRISWQDLKDYMRQAGEVTYADAHKQHRNEGVVEFASFSDMKNAIDKLDDTELNGRRIRLVEDKSTKRRRSASYSSRSRSRSRSAKRSRSRSRSRRSSRSKSKSRSRSRSGSVKNDRKSRSRSASHKKSVDRSRSNSRKKSVERSRSRSHSRSPDNKRSKSREESKERSRSRSASKGRSKSRSRSRSAN